jgi:hypothetical protein
MRRDFYKKLHAEDVRDLDAEGVQGKVKDCLKSLGPKGVRA